MANNVTLPAGGTGDTTPKVSTDQVTADSSQVQNVQLASVSGGALTRVPTGHGTASGALRVELPTDGTGVVALAAGATVALSAGSAIVGKVGIDQTTPGTTNLVAAGQNGTWTVQPGNTANSTPWLVTDTPATSGGLSFGKVLSAASTNATNLKGSAGQVFSIVLVNTNAAVRYLHLYNKATAPTVGTDTPVATIAIPGNTAGAGFSINFDKGIAFGTGIGYGLSTGAADNDSGAVAANEITGVIGYK